MDGRIPKIQAGEKIPNGNVLYRWGVTDLEELEEDRYVPKSNFSN